jgi:hypothetical protein
MARSNAEFFSVALGLRRAPPYEGLAMRTPAGELDYMSCLLSA